MSAYYINSYNIDDFEEFKNYPPNANRLIQKYGGEVLAADIEAIAVEGTARTMNAIVKFPSIAAALACYNDPEYQEIKMIRLRSTSSCDMLLVKEFIRA